MRVPHWHELAGAALIGAVVAVVGAGCAAITGVDNLVECSGVSCSKGAEDATVHLDAAVPDGTRDAASGVEASDAAILPEAADAAQMDASDAGPSGPCTSSDQCPVGQACQPATGQCSTSCNAGVACNGGCCDGTTCQPGTTSAACGSGGACAVCNQGCSGGVCTCKNLSDCGPLQACNQGNCSTSCTGGLQCNFGCCDSMGTCRNGLSDPGACGVGLSQCVACMGTPPICEGGVCR